MEAFDLIDANHDGCLQKKEVLSAIKEMQATGGIDLNINTVAMAEEMMREVDIDGNGQIDVNEFIEMMRKSMSASDGGENGGGLARFLAEKSRMSQLARNVLLAHQRKSENSVIGRDLWLIHPLGKMNAYWNVLISLLITLTVVTMPLSLGWDELKEHLSVMHLIVDVFYLLDVFKIFVTGLIDDNEAIIMDGKVVRWNYFTGSFLTDLCSSVPVQLFLTRAGKGNSVAATILGCKHVLKMIKLFRISEVFRLLRISRVFEPVKHIFVWIEEKLNFHISDGYTKLMRLGFAALILAHWIGCFNFMLVRLHDFPYDSWVVYAGLRDKSPYVQWSWSFFKALAQMIMIGFQTPP